MIYPIEFRTIPTQYSFLVEKKDNKYQVRSQILTPPVTQEFDTEKEARAFINRKEIL